MWSWRWIQGVDGWLGAGVAEGKGVSSPAPPEMCPQADSAKLVIYKIAHWL